MTTGMAKEGTVVLDGITLAIDRATEIKRKVVDAFGAVQRQNAQVSATDFELHQRFTLRPPWGIGQKVGGDPKRVWSEKNVNSLFSQLTRGPQRQTVTLPAGTIAYTRFQHARSELYAMSRTPGVLAGQTMTKFSIHAAADDRALTGYAAIGTPTVTNKTMNGTVGSSGATISINDNDNVLYIYGRWMGPALAAQTIAAQNWTPTFVTTGSTNRDARLYVLRPSTMSVVGYIFGTATALAAYASPFAGSSLVVQAGDVLVLEIGFTGVTSSSGFVLSYDNNNTYLTSANNITVSGALPAVVPGRLVYLSPAGDSVFLDTTADTDTAINYVQGLTVGGGRLLALSGYPYSPTGGQAYSVLAQSWDGLVWTSTNLQVQNQFGLIDIADVGGTIYLLYADDVSYPTKWTIVTLPATALTGTTAVAITAGVSIATVSSFFLPLRMVSHPNSAGVEKAWVTTPEGLYMEGVLMHRWNDTASGYSGTVLDSGVIRGRDSLMFNDGDSLYLGAWEPAGSAAVFLIRRMGPVVDDGMPEATTGIVTCAAYNIERDWFASGVGQDGNVTAGGIFIHAPGTRQPVSQSDVTDQIHKPYENATNYVIQAMTFTREADGTSKLIFMESTSTGAGPVTDTACFWFTHILDNPTTVAAYPYTDSGSVTTSELKPLNGLQNVGFLTVQVDPRDFSTTKKVSIKDGQDGAAPANAQAIVAATSPAQVWVDKTDASAGVGVSAKSQSVELTIQDNAANSTAGPTVNEITQTFIINANGANNAAVEEFDLYVDLIESSEYSATRHNPKAVYTAIMASVAKNTLLALVVDSNETLYVTATVPDVSYGTGLPKTSFKPSPQQPVGQAPSSGKVLIKCRMSGLR